MYEYILIFLKRPILKEISWYMVGQIGVQIFAFLGVLTTARYLGPINIGLYSFVQNYLLAFMSVLGSMEFYFSWKIAKSENRIHDLREYVWHKFYITLITIIVGVMVAWAVLPRDVAVLSTILFTPFILGSTSGFYSYAIAFKNAKLVAISQFISSLLILLTKIFFVKIKAPLMDFVAIGAIEVVLLTIILTIFYLRDKEIRQELFKNSFPNINKTFHFMYSIRASLVVIVLWQLIVRVDQFVLALLTNAYSLGIYAVAVKIAEVPNFFGSIMYTALISRVSIFADKEDKDSKLRIRKVLLTYFAIGTFFAIGIIITAPILVHILYGAKFIEATPVLRSYALSIPGMFLCLHYFAIYGAKGKHFHQSIIFFLGIIINVVFMYLLTPIMGLVGAALSTSLAYSFVALSFYFHAK